MARALKIAGAPPPRLRNPGFATLLRIIVDQQVSVQAGAAIWKKLQTGLGTVNVKRVRACDEDTLRGFGLSRGKAHYAKGLADAVADHSLNLKALVDADDDSVRDQLIEIKGIGRWTAEIYLMFALGRGDVWPAGDLALAVAAERLLDLDRRPSPVELDKIAESWRPYRTSAAVLLWHYYRAISQRS